TYSSEKIDKYNSSQIRIAIWKTSLENIKEAPIFGYGIGDVKSVLNESYKSNFPLLLEKNYNSHNQYFGIWLSTGIIGLLLFFYFLSFNYKLAIDSKDYLFLAILIFFSLNFLTENILERQTGAMLFFFLINLFGFYNYKKLLRLKL
ncbi:MAG: O-antigen ligase family protein, partial [Bacteroidota bacterium]